VKGIEPRSVEGRPLEDDELVKLAKRGNVRAYEELVERHRDVAVRTAFLVARDAADAEDATQEAFVKAYAALPRFRAGAPFRPWILRIVSNEARNRSRSARRRAGLALRAAAVRPTEEAAPSPEAAVLEREEQEMLLAALEALPDADRLVLGYRFLLGLSESETAAALGCRPGTVKSRTSRALARLRSVMRAAPANSGAGEGGGAP
jgi:RNA polymerase sigma-70 factor, ECF subfamily